MRTDTRYGPLGDHLSGVPHSTVTLSFSEIEAIIGRPLPPSASGQHGRQWWANTPTHSQGNAWIEAGWRVDNIDVIGRRVRFRKTASNSPSLAMTRATTSGDILSIKRSALSVRVQRMIAEYAEAMDTDEAAAVVRLLEDAALERRRRLINEMATRAPCVPGDSTELVREDRDAR
jgi:hypothetical protein